MPRRSARRTVSFHSVHCIHNGKPDLRSEIFIQIHQHIGKGRRLRKPHVVLRLRCSRNHAEQIFDTAGHSQHGVRLQLCKVNDHIRLIQPPGIIKCLCADRFRKYRLSHGGIQIQFRPRFLDSLVTGTPICTLKGAPGKQTSGTVSDNHLRSSLHKHLAQGRNKLRMCGYRLILRGPCHKICLNGNGHAR